MKPTILFLAFLVSFMCNVLVAQTLVTNPHHQNNNQCPLMEVNIQASNHIGQYIVSYCNHGNAIAENAYVELLVTNNVQITKSSIPVTFQEGNKYIFDLGDVASNVCTDFLIEIPYLPNQAHCTKVHIYPDDPCQAMIDYYTTLTTDNTGGGTGTGTNTNTLAAAASQRQPYIIDNGLQGQGTSNSIYEDHVFLSSVPIWDSLSHLPHSNINSGTGNNSSNNNNNNNNNNTTGNTATNDHKWSNNGSTSSPIENLSTAEHCHDASTNTTTVTTTETSIDGQLQQTNGSTNNNLNTQLANNELNQSTSSNLSISIAPNPFTSQTTIRIEGKITPQTTIQIVDLTGKTIKVVSINKQQQITIDKEREHLTQGVYFYRLSNREGQLQTGKLVVR